MYYILLVLDYPDERDESLLNSRIVTNSHVTEMVND